MSYRYILYASRGISKDLDHRFRKFQKSKLPSKVSTKPKTKMIEVEVSVDDKQ